MYCICILYFSVWTTHDALSQCRDEPLSVMLHSAMFVAFAELQIDMSEVTNDILSSSGLPFRDCCDYSVRVLFAGDKWQTYIMPENVS